MFLLKHKQHKHVLTTMLFDSPRYGEPGFHY